MKSEITFDENLATQNDTTNMNPHIDTFTPIIALFRDPATNSNRLYSITYTPNSSFEAGAIELGHPPGVATSPEYLAVTARIEKSPEGAVLWYLKPIVQSLEIADSTLERRTHITVFTVLGEGVVGSQTIKICPQRFKEAVDSAKAAGKLAVIACDGGFPWGPVGAC